MFYLFSNKRIKLKWIPGKVSHVCSQPNSYVVSTHDGRKFRRNRSAINVDRISSQPPAAPSVVRPQQPSPPLVPASVRAEPTPSSSLTPFVQQPPLSPPSFDSGALSTACLGSHTTHQSRVAQYAPAADT